MAGKPFRLTGDRSAGRLIDRSKPLSFTFDCQAMTGYQGDTLAAAVMANGRRVLGRSFKYHRPRGVLGLGAEEPNALVGIGEAGRIEPNLRASQVQLYEGLTATSQNRWPSLDFDIGILNNSFSRLFPAGFYYKTFMWPRSFWKHVYEPFIRRAAGLGVAAKEADPDIYEHMHAHCDVVVIGAGVAGLAAAQAAAANGARVIIADENPQFGGISDLSGGEINGANPGEWIGDVTAELAGSDRIHILPRTTVTGHYQDNYLLMVEHLGDHDPAVCDSGAPRHRLWKVRAEQVILASGALERPIAFANNDRPGIMLSSAVRGLVRRYGVAPGNAGVIFTNNDDAYLTALDLRQNGITVRGIIDTRMQPEGTLAKEARLAGIEVYNGQAVSGVVTSKGGQQIEAVKVAPYQPNQLPVSEEKRIECDFVAVSGGWNPAVHAWCHHGGKLTFDETLQSFKPDFHPGGMLAIGSANGSFSIADCLEEGFAAGESIAKKSKKTKRPSASDPEMQAAEAIWFAPASTPYHEGNKHFIDFQNDVTAADLRLAQREGYVSVEHTKRYTTLGMATDQGKTSNINGLGILAQTSGREIPEIGTTTFRPPYTPLSFGAITGTARKELFLPVRKTPVFRWHQQNNGDFEPVGHWRRAYCYPRNNEKRLDAVYREIEKVRRTVGILDASTLGKIEIKGPDAGKFLDLLYTNTFSTLKPGRCRYGLMMNEAGFLFDDGVTVCLAENHYLMHTTSGGADNVAAWLEEWLQTEWMDFKVYVTPVTEQWAQFAVAGPQARTLLEKLGGDIDLSAEAMPFMSMKTGEIGGYPVRLFRISFSGELSFEIATPANFGRGLWDALLAAGNTLDAGVYGTEALHILRAEKGFIVIGDETDGTVTPLDVGMNWAVSKKKADFIGKRSLEQSFLKSDGRKQLVGLETEDADFVLPDGAHAVETVKQQPPMTMIGHVTSSYWSPTLKRSIAMALIKDGQNRMGEVISFPLEDRVVQAKIVSPVFYDPEGERQNV